MKVTVYLASFAGTDAGLADDVRAFGTWLGENGHTLVYGGSKTGMMGELASAVLAAGGKVIGVQAQMFEDRGLTFEGLTELIVKPDLSSRKACMLSLGDAFLAFPGGTGTLEEIAEVMSQVSLKLKDAPCILFDRKGFYRPMRALFDNMCAFGLSNAQRLSGIRFAQSVDEIAAILNESL